MTTELEPGGALDAPVADDVAVDDIETGDEHRLGGENVELTVGRGVIVEVARLAALEIPEVIRVARRGPPWRAALAGPPITVHVGREGVDVELRIIARPGADLATAGRHVRDAVGKAVERLLGLQVRSVVVLVDGVGS